MTLSNKRCPLDHPAISTDIIVKRTTLCALAAAALFAHSAQAADFSLQSKAFKHTLKVDKLPVDKGASPALVGFMLWQNRIAQATLGVTAGPRK